MLFCLVCGSRTYTRDWLLTYQNQCLEVPAGLDDSDVQRGDGGGAPGGGRPGMGGAFDMRGPRGSGGHGPPAMGPPGIGLGPGGAPGLDSKRWDRGTMRGPDGVGPPPGPPGETPPCHVSLHACNGIISFRFGKFMQSLGSNSFFFYHLLGL